MPPARHTQSAQAVGMLYTDVTIHVTIAITLHTWVQPWSQGGGGGQLEPDAIVQMPMPSTNLPSFP